MSTYSQSEVARIVESVLPDILKSGDPQTTLIKRATELNLPPAVLEKAGQVYNTAKTLNHLEGVDDLEKRGNTFTTLDVPKMVEVYEEYEAYDPSKASKHTQASDLWQEALFGKAASADIETEYELPEAFNPLLHERKDPLEKMASSATVNSFNGEDQGAAIRAQRAKVAAERDLETCHNLIATLERDFIRKTAMIADQYLGLYVDAPDMDRLEAETAKVTGKSKLVKQAFDKVASMIEKYPASKKHIKRASEDTKVGLVLENGYHELVKQALDHLEILNAAHEEYAELEKAAAIKGYRDDKKKNELTPHTQTPLPLSHPEEADKKDGSNETDESEEQAQDAEGAKSVYNRKLQLNRLWSSSEKPRKAIGDTLVQSLKDTQNERQLEIDNAGLIARGEAALNTLLLTDPVISEYDEEQMRDIFFTVLRENPEVATDINELRGILRAAGSFDGVVDLESAKQLKSLRKIDREAQGKTNQES